MRMTNEEVLAKFERIRQLALAMKSAKHAAPENAEYEAPEMWYLTHEILQLAKEIQASLASSEREDAEEQDHEDVWEVFEVIFGCGYGAVLDADAARQN